jgi:hypothetical protein
MSTGTTKAPALPLAPVEYDKQFMDQVLNILRLYFQQMDNAGPSAASSQRTFNAALNRTVIVSAMNFSTINQLDVTKPRVVSLPTQANLALLRVGDVYYDTTAGNVLKIKV